jgi:uncharacterized protein (DUF1697 family)
MTRVAALLQGVNLGGKRKVPMPELRAHLTELGYEDVGTYVASGNVVLTSSRTPATLERALTRQISDWAGIEVPVLVRTHRELAQVVKRNPLGKVVDNPSRYLVAFLSKAPGREALADLDAAAVEPERIELHGRELYTWHPDGAGRSKLAALLNAKKLGVVVTARNWNTVTKLVSLTAGGGRSAR